MRSQDDVEYAAGRMGNVAPWWKSRIIRKYWLPVGFLELIALLLTVSASDIHHIQFKVRKTWGFFMSEQLVVAVLVLVTIASTVVAVVLIERFFQKKQKHSSSHENLRKTPITDTHTNEDDARIRRRFNNVFAMMSADRRRELVEYYKRSHSCDITTAMQMAIDDLRNEQERYK